MTDTPEEIMARAIRGRSGDIYWMLERGDPDDAIEKAAKAAIKALEDEGFVIVPRSEHPPTAGLDMWEKTQEAQSAKE